MKQTATSLSWTQKIFPRSTDCCSSSFTINKIFLMFFNIFFVLCCSLSLCIIFFAFFFVCIQHTDCSTAYRPVVSVKHQRRRQFMIETWTKENEERKKRSEFKKDASVIDLMMRNREREDCFLRYFEHFMTSS